MYVGAAPHTCRYGRGGPGSSNVRAPAQWTFGCWQPREESKTWGPKEGLLVSWVTGRSGLVDVEYNAGHYQGIRLVELSWRGIPPGD